MPEPQPAPDPRRGYPEDVRDAMFDLGAQREFVLNALWDLREDPAWEALIDRIYWAERALDDALARHFPPPDEDQRGALAREVHSE